MGILDIPELEPTPRNPAILVQPISNPDQPPQIGVTVTLPTGTRFSVERSTDGSILEPVRGASNITMPAGGQFFVNDWAAPIGIQVHYVLRVNGLIHSSTHTTVHAHGISWIQDAFNPQDGIPVRIDRLHDGAGAYDPDSFRTAHWPQHFDEVQVLGATLPVESVGVRSRTGNIPLIIHTLIPQDANRLRRLLFDAGILLIRGVECDMLPPSAFVALPDVTEIHQGNPHEVATFTATARFTREPNPLLSIAFWTWRQVSNLVADRFGRDLNGNPNATWQQVTDATDPATWAQITNDPNLIGANR